jgi:hypothetical protein
MLLCMSVNVRWNGRGWPGKVPVASPKKNGRPKGTVKAVWQKTGMAIKKKNTNAILGRQMNYIIREILQQWTTFYFLRKLLILTKNFI